MLLSSCHQQVGHRRYTWCRNPRGYWQFLDWSWIKMNKYCNLPLRSEARENDKPVIYATVAKSRWWKPLTPLSALPSLSRWVLIIHSVCWMIVACSSQGTYESYSRCNSVKTIFFNKCFIFLVFIMLMYSIVSFSFYIWFCTVLLLIPI